MRGEYDVRREWHGPSYDMLMSATDQRGDPAHPARWPHGVPSGLRPSLIDMLPVAARVLPVTQEVPHGEERSREEEFDLGVAQSSDLGRAHRQWGLAPVGTAPWHYQDRRVSGRRYRPTDNEMEKDGPQEAPPRGGWQADIPMSRYLSF